MFKCNFVSIPEIGNDISVCVCVFICEALYPEGEGKVDSCLLFRGSLVIRKFMRSLYILNCAREDT